MWFIFYGCTNKFIHFFITRTTLTAKMELLSCGDFFMTKPFSNKHVSQKITAFVNEEIRGILQEL